MPQCDQLNHTSAMRGFCAKCGRSFDGQMLCPLCGVQLQSEPDNAGLALNPTITDETSDGPSFLRRLVFGGITLLGLYHGLKHLALAAVIAQAGPATLSADTHISLLVVSMLVAGVVAGTVNRRAELTGLLLALAASVLFLGPDLLHTNLIPEEWLLGVPTLLALVGVVGGFAGRLMIPPAPNLPTFGRLDSHVVVVRIKRPPERIAWIQVMAGIAFTVAGAVYVDSIRSGLAYVLAGQSASFGARPLIAWQISTLAALVGGVITGYGSRGGIRQAIFAGVGAGATVVLALAMHADSAPATVIDFWTYQLDLKSSNSLPYVALGVTTMMATTLGGWFGGQIRFDDNRK
jgi:hypothetical protein